MRLQLEQIIDIARQPIELQHLGNFSHRRREWLEPFVGILGCPQHHEDGRADAEFFGVEQRHPLSDDAAVRQLPDAPPAGVVGQMDLFCDLADRMRCVLLQEIENLDVHRVEVGRRKSSPGNQE
ncbi:MAG TPA: hypothetical protein VGL97_16910 [Bryobacteraceae bacterium]